MKKLNQQQLVLQRQQQATGSYAEGIPSRFRRLFLKVTSGRGGKRDIIRAKCQACVGHEDVSDRVGNCTCYLCPIWPYRPYQDQKEKQ